MKKRILIIMLIGLLSFMAGCVQKDSINTNPHSPDTTPSKSETADVSEDNGSISANPHNPDTTPSKSETADVSKDLDESTPAWYSAYAPYISAYSTFENSGQPIELIRTPFTEHYWPAANYNSEGVIVFALYDINSNGSPELIIGYKHGNEQEGYYFNVCDVYTIDSGSLKRIIACYPADEFYTINTHSIKLAEGNIIVTTTEYSLSLDGNLIEEYSISIALDSADHEANEIIQVVGKSLNDTLAELDWKRLHEY